jgi:hypothetical protein
MILSINSIELFDKIEELYWKELKQQNSKSQN